MSIDNVVLWYEKNVNYKLTKTFLDFIIKIGIVNEDIDLELLNSFLLETFGDEFIKENDRYKIKENRIQIINNLESNKEKITEKENVIKTGPVTLIKSENSKKIKNKFKIENLGGRKLKLVKIK